MDDRVMKDALALKQENPDTAVFIPEVEFIDFKQGLQSMLENAKANGCLAGASMYTKLHDGRLIRLTAIILD